MTSDACINLTGNLVADPELQTTNNNSKYVEFRMAVSTTEKNSNGDYITNFYKIQRYGSESELNGLMSTAQKGTGVSVNGMLAMTEYAKHDGTTGYTLKVNANHIKIMARAKNANAAPVAKPAAKSAQPAQPATDEDALPF